MDKPGLDSYGFSGEMVKALENLGYETLTEVQAGSRRSGYHRHFPDRQREDSRFCHTGL